FLIVILSCAASMAAATSPACKIRVTSRGLDLVRDEGLKFLEQELENITIPDLSGKEGGFHYTVKEVKITDLYLPAPDLWFQPQKSLGFHIENASITLNFQRKILYWFFRDVGSINASAEGVNMKTTLEMSKDAFGRLKISNVTCNASISKMHAKFSGTLGRVYDFIATFITTGMRFLLNRQICPALNHASLVLLNSFLDTVPVRSEVDNYVGIDYSLLSDPVVSANSLDMDFKGMFYDLSNENHTLTNYAVTPVIKQNERMVYVAFSEYFFDSALYSYYKAGAYQMEISDEKMPKDLEVFLRTTYLGTIMLLMKDPSAVDAPMKLEIQVSTPPRCTIKPSGTTVSVNAILKVILAPEGRPPIQLSSMTMETKMNGRISLNGKKLLITLSLKRFKIYSNQSALESLALIPLQSPLKTLLQIAVMPIINVIERTKKGVQIPLPEGMDFVKDDIENHAGFIIVAADLHFSKGLGEIINKYRSATESKPAANPKSSTAV
uniref:Phospholipid transfer protein n=1 Tax=Latimeria chalumnae TaxID=7897 RepID=H3BHE9_LATCH